MPKWNLSECQNGIAVLNNGNFMLRFQVYGDSIIRVTQTSANGFKLIDDPMIIARPSEMRLNLASDNDTYFTTDLRSNFILDRASGRLQWLNNGQIFMKEPLKDGRVLREIEIVKQHFDPNAKPEEYVSVDGIKARAAGEPYVDRHGYQTRLSFEFDDDEDIYGLGQHEQGILNYRGQHQLLYQHNLKISAPVIFSSNGWAVLNNSCGAQIFHDDAFGSYISCDAADELDYFVIYGPEFDDLIRGIRYLTGDCPMLPRWTAGYVQSKEHYHTAEELLSTADEYRRRGIPLDCIVQDWQTWPEGQWGQKTADKTRYPDPKGLIDNLHDKNVKLMLSIWPNMNGDCPNQNELTQKGQMLGNKRTYNAFDPEARKTYWTQCNEEWFPAGLDAWWCDCTEPFEADWFGEVQMLPEDRMYYNLAEFKRYIDPTKVLAYSIYHSMALYEGQRGTTDKKRVVNLTRSGLTGQQRYSTICWNGDVSASWDVLKKSVPEGLNLMLSGIPYWTVDAGGFFVKRWQQWFGRGEYEQGCNDENYRELYVRWLQYSAFLPMMRSHGADTPREVWQFGEPGEPYYDALVSIIKLRYALIPYIYSEMAAVHFDHSTIMRMLAFDFRTDKTARNINDQFMFGSSLMVCPILSPMVDGMAERDVYLPAGKNWYDLWSGAKYDGGQWLHVSVPLNGIPVFVPEGSIIPTGPDIQYADECAGKDITIYIYGGCDSDFHLYNDAGDGYGYEAGEYCNAKIKWFDADGSYDITYSGDERFKPEIDNVNIIS